MDAVRASAAPRRAGLRDASSSIRPYAGMYAEHRIVCARARECRESRVEADRVRVRKRSARGCVEVPERVPLWFRPSKCSPTPRVTACISSRTAPRLTVYMRPGYERAALIPRNCTARHRRARSRCLDTRPRKSSVCAILEVQTACARSNVAVISRRHPQQCPRKIRAWDAARGIRYAHFEFLSTQGQSMECGMAASTQLARNTSKLTGRMYPGATSTNPCFFLFKLCQVVAARGVDVSGNVASRPRKPGSAETGRTRLNLCAEGLTRVQEYIYKIWGLEDARERRGACFCVGARRNCTKPPKSGHISFAQKALKLAVHMHPGATSAPLCL